MYKTIEDQAKRNLTRNHYNTNYDLCILDTLQQPGERLLQFQEEVIEPSFDPVLALQMMAS